MAVAARLVLGNQYCLSEAYDVLFRSGKLCNRHGSAGARRGSVAPWRFLMFLPLAAFLAVVVRIRPSLLPYLLIVHALLDLSVVAALAAGLA